MIDGEFVDAKNIFVVLFMIAVIFVNFMVDMVRWLYAVVQNNNLEEVGEKFRNTMSRKSFVRRHSSSSDDKAVQHVVISPLAGAAEPGAGPEPGSGAGPGGREVELTLSDSSRHQEAHA